MDSDADAHPAAPGGHTLGSVVRVESSEGCLAEKNKACAGAKPEPAALAPSIPQDAAPDCEAAVVRSGSDSNGVHSDTALSELGALPGDGKHELDARPSAQKKPRKLFSSANVSAVISDKANDDRVSLLQKAVFADHRWKQGMEHLKADDYWRTGRNLQHLLCRGAKVFGFWHLSEEVLDVLAQHLLEDSAPQPSPAMRVVTAKPMEHQNTSSSRFSDRFSNREEAGKAAERAKQKKPETRRSQLDKHLLKLVVAVVFTILSILYAFEVCFVMYPNIMQTLSVMLFFARAAGFGTLLYTALLFATMSRSAMRTVGRILPWPSVQRAIDDHKEMHIFSANMMFVNAFIHVVSHATGTVPSLLSHSVEELNGVIGCANKDSTPGYLGVSFGILQKPACPFIEPPRTFWLAVFQSTPGVTGLLLVLLATVLYYTAGAARRKANFELFQYTHNAAFPIWLTLLFLHGTNGWVGVGFPLVAFICIGPVTTYFLDRILRLLRYYLFTDTQVKIVDVVIRPGGGNASKGALVNLMISKPPYLWKFRDGMYAFLNMPDYAPGQWHPFTICSGTHDETVDFIINGVGDWTCELAKKCLEAYEGRGDLPRIAMDGPYLAPTVTAKYRRVLVAVGAGVGITPFLSLMSTISAVLSDKKKRERLPLQEAHFYWMTRSADEFLFGRKHFTKIASNANLRGRVFLHLHVTQKEPDKDVEAFLFREAVRRQSRTDRDLFDKASEAGGISLAPQLPWCWVHHGREDVMWVKSLIDCNDHTDNERLAEADVAKHWSSGYMRRSSSLTSPPSSGTVGPKKGWLQQMVMATASSNASKHAKREVEEQGIDLSTHPGSAYMPIAFGRPDFAKEIYSIGCARPDDDVHVYVCGNDVLVESLQKACDACTEQAKARESGKPQMFEVHFERFG